MRGWPTSTTVGWVCLWGSAACHADWNSLKGSAGERPEIQREDRSDSCAHIGALRSDLNEKRRRRLPLSCENAGVRALNGVCDPRHRSPHTSISTMIVNPSLQRRVRHGHSGRRSLRTSVPISKRISQIARWTQPRSASKETCCFGHPACSLRSTAKVQHYQNEQWRMEAKDFCLRRTRRRSNARGGRQLRISVFASDTAIPQNCCVCACGTLRGCSRRGLLGPPGGAD